MIRLSEPEPIGEAWKARFLQLFLQHRSYSVAAKAIGQTRDRLELERENDPVFDKQWRSVEESITDDLEASALKRAIDGWQEPVYYKGKKVGYRTVFSPTLTLKMLACRRPKKYGMAVIDENTDDYAKKMLISLARMKASIPAPTE